MEGLILTGLGLWLLAALRFCTRHKGGCGGNCGACKGCGSK